MLALSFRMLTRKRYFDMVFPVFLLWKDIVKYAAYPHVDDACLMIQVDVSQKVSHVKT